jgi:hypothetical protein
VNCEQHAFLHGSSIIRTRRKHDPLLCWASRVLVANTNQIILPSYLLEFK